VQTERQNMPLEIHAHQVKDQFLLETYLLVGAAVVSAPTLFIERNYNSILLSTQAIAYLVLIVTLIRLSRASFAAYKYLFSIIASDHMALTDNHSMYFELERNYRKLRNVSPIWFISALLSTILIAAIKLISIFIC